MTVVINSDSLLDKTALSYAQILQEQLDTLLNSGSQRCCQWVSYSKIFIFQNNSIYICSLPLALICLLITRLVFVFQMLKRLCWFVQEICLDRAHKVYLLTFDIFTGWETKWKIWVIKLHRWHLSQSTSPELGVSLFQAVSGTRWQWPAGQGPTHTQGFGASWGLLKSIHLPVHLLPQESQNIQVLNCDASTANKCKTWQYNGACGYFTYSTFTCV